jgi:hypothetical protein
MKKYQTQFSMISAHTRIANASKRKSIMNKCIIYTTAAKGIFCKTSSTKDLFWENKYNDSGFSKLETIFQYPLSFKRNNRELKISSS